MAKMTLFTMPPSPYCEKARWALDLTGRTYREERYPFLFHRGALKRNGGGKTVPFLVLENNRTCQDSAEIMKWVDEQFRTENRLFPVDPEKGPLVKDFCLRCERDLAPQVSRFFYYHMSKEQFFRVCTQGCDHDHIKKFRYLAFFVRQGMNKKQQINTDGFRDALKKLDRFWNTVDAMLSDGRRYLFCDRLTAADITFCSMAANLILVPEFGGASLLFDECPPEIHAEVDRFRKTKVGIYIQAVYKRFRKYVMEP